MGRVTENEVRLEERGELLAKLKEAQSKSGYVPREVISELAEFYHLPLSDVYGVATFYSFLSIRPQGKYVIKVCKSIPCFLREYQVILEAIEREIGIKANETTVDGRFSIQLTNCIGACDKAPSIMINDDFHTDVTPDKIPQILREYQ